jgi:hypothetical protein
MERIVLVGFLPCDNGFSCNLHPFGCGNSLVLNRPDYGVGIRLHIRMTIVLNKLACYIMNSNGSDGCRVCYVAREYTAGQNAPRLDGRIIKNHAGVPVG